MQMIMLYYLCLVCDLLYPSYLISSHVAFPCLALPRCMLVTHLHPVSFYIYVLFSPLIVDSVRIDIQHALAQLEEDEKKVGQADNDSDTQKETEKDADTEKKTDGSEQKDTTSNKATTIPMTDAERISVLLKKVRHGIFICWHGE